LRGKRKIGLDKRIQLIYTVSMSLAKPTPIRIDETQKVELKRHATIEHNTVAGIIRRAIERELARLNAIDK